MSKSKGAINEALSNQVLPQIQKVIMAGPGHVTRKGWNVSTERPEPTPEVQRNLNAKNNLRNEQDKDHQNGGLPSHNVHDISSKHNQRKTKLGSFFIICKPTYQVLNKS